MNYDNSHFRITILANGFLLEEKELSLGSNRDALMPNRYCFNTREALAQWFISQMEPLAFEERKTEAPL